jgi:SAM-dependent methyltransferase
LLARYEAEGTSAQFETAGFAKIMRMFPLVRELHIDIGCGIGWLLLKTAPQFKRVVGIDPSHDAIRIAGDVVKGHGNIELLESDMVDALKKIAPRDPAFITTSTVLSHIEDWYVTDFLQLVNNMPQGSILFFGEPYGKNIQRKLWHVRSKQWWAENLPDWELLFSDFNNDGMAYGIGGVKVGTSSVLNKYRQSTVEAVWWKVTGAVESAKVFFKVMAKFFMKRKAQ